MLYKITTKLHTENREPASVIPVQEYCGFKVSVDNIRWCAVCTVLDGNRGPTAIFLPRAPTQLNPVMSLLTLLLLTVRRVTDDLQQNQPNNVL